MVCFVKAEKLLCNMTSLVQHWLNWNWWHWRFVIRQLFNGWWKLCFNKANPVDTANTSETWARFQVGSVPLINFTELLLGDKRTQTPLKKGQGRRKKELNTCGICASYNVPKTCNIQHIKRPKLFYLLNNEESLARRRLGMGKTFSSRHIHWKITRHTHDLKWLHIIRKIRHPSYHKSNKLDTWS